MGTEWNYLRIVVLSFRSNRIESYFCRSAVAVGGQPISVLVTSSMYTERR